MTEFVRQRWGISILSLWSFVLAVTALAKMSLLSRSTAYTNDTMLTQLMILFALNGILGLGFSFSTYGLWTRQNWGRILFLWLITFWSGSNLLILFDPRFLSKSSSSELIIDGLRFTMSLILPLWYLNLPHIKILFLNSDKPS